MGFITLIFIVFINNNVINTFTLITIMYNAKNNAQHNNIDDNDNNYNIIYNVKHYIDLWV